MNTTGSTRQEDKITYMENIARKMFPEISIKSFNEAFYFGVEAALKEHNYEQWSEVIKEQPLSRQTFFKSVLKGVKIGLQKTKLKTDQVELLIKTLGKKNRRYLG